MANIGVGDQRHEYMNTWERQGESTVIKWVSSTFRRYKGDSTPTSELQLLSSGGTAFVDLGGSGHPGWILFHSHF